MADTILTARRSGFTFLNTIVPFFGIKKEVGNCDPDVSDCQ
ncbi:hypothetical protein [Lyngbya sp. CCY1209]|nr:hypothetical protein [Lyngbya sp. CCY1209]